MKKTNALKYVSLFSLSLSFASIYALVYIKYVLYNPMVEAFNISNAQMGMLMSVYAILCMILYIPGGIVADKISTKKILISSLLVHGALSIFLSFSMQYTIAVIVWFLFGITSGFAFWAALVKGVLSLSTQKDSGLITGLYALGCALFSALINVILISVYNRYDIAKLGMSRAILASGIITIISALIILAVFKDNQNSRSSTSQEFNKKYVPQLLKSPILWAMSLTIFCVYGLRVAGNTFFNPYLVDLKGFDLSQAAFVGVIRSNILPLMAPIAGFFADRVFKSTAKMLRLFFVMLILTFIFVIFIPDSAPIWLVITISLIPGALSGMGYGIVFSILRETKTPEYMMGTVIGITSIIGYLPDFIFDPVFGTVLDKFGNNGFTIIFVSLAIVAIVGIFSCNYIVKYKQNSSDNSAKHLI